jgi:hypothetical protein
MDELLLQLAALDEQIDTLLEADDLTAEQRTQHDSLQAQRKKLLAKIDRLQDPGGPRRAAHGAGHGPRGRRRSPASAPRTASAPTG